MILTSLKVSDRLNDGKVNNARDSCAKGLEFKSRAVTQLAELQFVSVSTSKQVVVLAWRYVA